MSAEGEIFFTILFKKTVVKKIYIAIFCTKLQLIDSNLDQFCLLIYITVKMGISSVAQDLSGTLRKISANVCNHILIIKVNVIFLQYIYFFGFMATHF